MSFRELALNYLCRFEGMPIVEADIIALEALLEMAAEVGEEREKLKNDWMSQEVTKEYGFTDEVTS